MGGAVNESAYCLLFLKQGPGARWRLQGLLYIDMGSREGEKRVISEGESRAQVRQ
jgi:hypothetical protein